MKIFIVGKSMKDRWGKMTGSSTMLLSSPIFTCQCIRVLFILRRVHRVLIIDCGERLDLQDLGLYQLCVSRTYVILRRLACTSLLQNFFKRVNFPSLELKENIFLLKKFLWHEVISEPKSCSKQIFKYIVFPPRPDINIKEDHYRQVSRLQCRWIKPY